MAETPSGDDAGARSFVGRDDEQRRFRQVLREVTGKPPRPDHGFAVLVRGYGGIGKSTLLRRFREIGAGELPEDRRNRRRFTVVTIDWETDRDDHPGEYTTADGPPIHKVLNRL